MSTRVGLTEQEDARVEALVNKDRLTNDERDELDALSLKVITALSPHRRAEILKKLQQFIGKGQTP